MNSEREWQAQERALEIERGAVNERGEVDDTVAKYRLIARALRKSVVTTLPADFAASVAEQAERNANVAAGERFERWLQHALVLLLITSAIVFAATFGKAWLVPPAGTNSAVSWIICIAACVAVSFAIEYRRRSDRSHSGPFESPA